MTKRRPVALGAALAIGLGGLFAASPALAVDGDAPSEDQNTTSSAQNGTDEAQLPAVVREADQVKSEIKKDTGAEIDVIGAGYDADGELTVLANEEATKAADRAEVAEGYGNVAFLPPAEARASDELVGGQGYMMEVEGGLSACSFGFSAFSPEGDPAILSAGHCTGDSSVTDVALSTPSSDPANGGEGYEQFGGVIGQFGFSQFGGPGHTPGADEDPTSTDISVIDIADDSLTLLPQVTDWSTAGDDDLAAGVATTIKSVADPVAGEVKASGRTTSLNTGDTDVTIDGQRFQILDGWLQIEDRWVHGFLSDVYGQGGDSGGSVFQGDKAVGVVSGGDEAGTYTWATRLADALEYTDGYEVALDINEPVVASPEDGAEIEGGSDIVVKVPANATELAVGNGSSGDVIPTDGKREITLKAQETPGEHTLSLVAQNGFSHSETVEFTYTSTIAKPVIDDVEITAPKGEDSVDVEITGTGIVGAEVTVEGYDPTTVEDDGTWTVGADEFEIGSHDLTATQSAEGETSAEATGSIKVLPAKVDVLSPADGDKFDEDNSPTTVTGTGIVDATVTVKVDGKTYTTEVVEGDNAGGMSGEQALANNSTRAAVDQGTWAVELDAAPGAGTHELRANQALNGTAAESTVLSFAVTAADDGGSGDGGAGDGGSGDAGEGDGGAGDGGSGDAGEAGDAGGDDLAVTGADINMLPIGLVALGLLTAGAGTAFFAYRNRKASMKA